MRHPSKRLGTRGSQLLAVLILLGMGILFIPILHCRVCWREYSAMLAWAEASVKAHPEMEQEVEANLRGVTCAYCGNRHRVSLFGILTESPCVQNH